MVSQSGVSPNTEVHPGEFRGKEETKYVNRIKCYNAAGGGGGGGEGREILITVSTMFV